MTLDEINALDQQHFVAALGGLFEGPPWIVALARKRRPFASAQALHEALQGRAPNEFPPLDLASGTEFQQQVWGAMRRIADQHGPEAVAFSQSSPSTPAAATITIGWALKIQVRPPKRMVTFSRS